MEVSSPIDRFLEDETPSDEITDGTGGAPKDSWVFLGGKQVRASSINVAILGSGSFGTSMGVYLAGKGVNVTVVVRKPEVAEAINHEHRNPSHLSEIELPPNMGACVDPALAFGDADFIFHAVPCQFSRATLSNIRHLMPPEVPVICLTKGIETESLMMMSEVLEDVLGKERPMAYLSGPSFAMEIAQGLATAVTIASSDRDLGNDVMSLLKSRQFRGLCAPRTRPAAPSRCALCSFSARTLPRLTPARPARARARQIRAT